MYQCTIKKEVKCQGVGIHTGKFAELTFKPAPVGTGVIFVRIDLPGSPKVAASLQNVEHTRRGTKLKNLYVVEHLLAALYGLGIDNVLIEISGGEPPAMDGSALPYVELLEEAEIVEQEKEKEFIIIKEPISVPGNTGKVEALPYNGFKVQYVIDFPESIVGRQEITLEIDKKSFIKEIAPARTFGFWEEVASLWKEGLGLGGSLENAIVVGKDGYSCPLRFPDEPVRHKILDLVGDLALLEKPIQGYIKAYKAGHALHLELAKEVLIKCQK